MVYVSALILDSCGLLLVRKIGEHGTYNWMPPGGRLLENKSGLPAESDVDGLVRIMQRDFLNPQIAEFKHYKDIDYSSLVGIPSLNRTYITELDGELNPNYQRLRSTKFFSSTHHINLSPLSIALIDQLKKDRLIRP